MVPYPTVLHQVESLSEELYNTIPAQPPPSVPPQRTKAQLKQGTGSQSSEPNLPAKSSSGTELHEVPPDGDPLEEANIWVEILKLEPRKTNNRIAEGFANWLKTNMDSTLHEVTKFPFIYKLS